MWNGVYSLHSIWRNSLQRSYWYSTLLKNSTWTSEIFHVARRRTQLQGRPANETEQRKNLEPSAIADYGAFKWSICVIFPLIRYFKRKLLTWAGL